MACPLREDLHQRDLPNTVRKKIFKTFQSQVSVDITDNFRSLSSKDGDGHWNPESSEVILSMDFYV